MLRILCVFSSLALAAAKDQAVVLVVDPAWDDSAGYVLKVPILKGYKIVKAMTRRGPSKSYMKGHVEFFNKFTYDSDSPDAVEGAKQICPQLKAMGVEIAAVIPTSDGAVALTDQLAACVGVRGNPITGELALARRDKWAMGQAVKRAGLRSVHQKRVSTWAAAETFLQSWDPPLSTSRPSVFKILAGSGGEGTVQVNNLAQAKAFFDSVHGTANKYGDSNTDILIQEFLVGREYAVDAVTRDGVHKVIAVWFEDFRPANGIFDQYFGFKIMDPSDPLMKKIVDYSNAVLDATGVMNGATNTEVKWLVEENQPCLVEVNARWAGISWNDGLAVEQACVGTDQITSTFDTYLSAEKFDAMPMVRPLKQHGAVIFTLNYQSGILTKIPGIDAVKKYPSYHSLTVDSSGGIKDFIGKVLHLTTPDTCPLEIALVNKDRQVVDADYDRILALEKANKFFQTEPLMGRHGWAPPAFLADSGDDLDHNSLVAHGGVLAVALMVVAMVGAVTSSLISGNPRQQDIEEAGYVAVE